VIPRECKRLAEVDFPIAVVSKHAAREKSIRHGHPSTLHLWWARRPLAACRAMLMALLLPDPQDEHCPEDFKTKARELLRPLPGKVEAGDAGLRKALLRFIGDFANWDLAADRTYLDAARGLVKAAHPEETPLVVDPFAGGGSIPLEALRLGCDAFASDLNPVACLILKVMLEDIPRQGPGLAEELRKSGAEIRNAAEKDLGRFYPPDPDGARPIAYLWARTVRCESPHCGAEIPLVRSWWLSRKAGRRRALRPRVVRTTGVEPRVELDLYTPKGDKDIAPGTVKGARATCLCCGMTLHPDRVRTQLRGQAGGADPVFGTDGCRSGGAVLLAVVTTKRGETGRRYRLATREDYRPIRAAGKMLATLFTSVAGKDHMSAVPDEAVVQERVAKNSPFRFHLYGFSSFGAVSTIRQQTYLATLAAHVRRAAGSSAARDCLSIVVDRVANASTSLCRWHNSGEKLEGMFSRQAVSMVWDFCEGAPFGDASGGLDGALEWVLAVIEKLGGVGLRPGQTQQATATAASLPDQSANVWFTDPPYYDAVSYADLSDFFYAWIKRTAARTISRVPDEPGNPLTPKSLEIIQDDAKSVAGRPKDRVFFEDGMAQAFQEGRRVLRDEGIASIVFAHKTTEGWEALLSGIIRAGLTITGSWPVATEMSARLRARDSAALATSIHLVCRPRAGTLTADWAQVVRELPTRVSEWMDRLDGEGVHGADLVFACIGPALELYTRYHRVVDAEEREIPLGGDPEAKLPHLRGYLAYVWEAVGRTALQRVLSAAEANARNGSAGALEEDSRLTALFLWTLRSTDADAGDGEEDEGEVADEDDTGPGKKKAGLALPYDVVRRFAQPLGIHLETWEHRIIEIEKGVVRLLPVAERAATLFPKGGVGGAAAQLERGGDRLQMVLFAEEPQTPKVRGPKKRAKAGATAEPELDERREATTLDRVHAAMLLQRAGQTNALRNLLKAEQQRGPDFLRLANALSALYPKDFEEKRILDAMLLAVPR
jgi:adenine-specific DNA methylase